jgi:Sulfotransferase family
MKEENLIFIISQPRSGSTYLQNLLSNNEQVNTRSEPWILLNYVNQIKPKLIEGAYDNNLAIGAYHIYKEAFPAYDSRAKLKQHLLDIYEPLKQSYSHVIDKTPRYWEIIDEIGDLFPKARIIVLKRDPIAVVQSLVKTYEMQDLKELVPFKRDLLYGPKKLAAFCNKNKTNSQVYSLRYEDLLKDTESQTKKLYEWIGIDFDKNVLDVSENNKYRGHFGDPFQNKSTDYASRKKNAEQHTISNRFQKFISGYASTLGAEFMEDYGGYKIQSSTGKTSVYSYYEFLCAQDNMCKESLTLKNLFKKMYFALKLG